MGEESCYKELKTISANGNIRICTTAAKSSWSNNIVEHHNAIFSLTVKNIKESRFDLN